ncbi:MAG: hypothetical protein FWC26_12375 [Fibromonadales bacterium]|nr:hypothetical protein [Fibromonadales bacterium]
MNKFMLFFAIILSSCTHWLIDTETRIQMENNTGVEIHNLSLVSQNGQTKVLVPDTLKAGDRSRIYEYEWVGEFGFAVFSEGSQKDLGVHRLKGGIVLAQIKEENGKFVMRLR